MRHATTTLDLICNILFVALYALSRASFGQPAATTAQEQAGSTETQERRHVDVEVFASGLRMEGRIYGTVEEVIGALPRSGEPVMLVLTGGDESVTDRRVGRCARELAGYAGARAGLEVRRR